MKFLFLTLTATLLVFSTAHGKPAAPDFCIKSQADYNARKSELPNFLQYMPALLGGDGKVAIFKVVAAVKLSFKNGVMEFQSDVHKPGGRYTDQMEISSACFYKKAGRIKMKFSNGVVSESKYNNTQLISQGFAMQRVTPAAHQALIAKISSRNGGKPGKETPVGVGN
jgi:hypothetical protein